MNKTEAPLQNHVNRDYVNMGTFEHTSSIPENTSQGKIEWKCYMSFMLILTALERNYIS